MTQSMRGEEQVNSAHGSTTNKKVQCTHSFEKTDFERQLAFEQTSGVPDSSFSRDVADVLLTTIDTR